MPTKKIQIVGSLVPDVATSDQNGLMSSADKAKLDGIAANANNYSLPSSITANVTGNLTGTASKATADASGNNIANTYAKKTELANKADVGHTHTGYAPAYTYGTEDLEAGVSPLGEGVIYFVYE